VSDTPLTKQAEALAGVDLTQFRPNDTQARAKARLHEQLRRREGVIEFANLTAQELADLAGTQRVLQWLREPGFAAWFADKDTFVYEAIALKETVIAVFRDIMRADYEPGILTAKDKIKAGTELLKLADAYPVKQREVRFLDKDLESMPPDMVQAELTRIRAGLAKELPAADT
jgi:hypothetical protein